MDAISSRIAVALLVWFVALAPLSAAEYATDNFVVTAGDADFAKKVAMTAERWRVRLAKEWLGYTLPNWSSPCPIRVQVGQIGAGGETTFRFALNPETGRNEVYGWRMRVQGTAERILDSVIPHEVSHTIFASHFRRPLPRWADEGAATLAEHRSEQRRQDLTLKQVWDSGRFPLKTLLSMTEYPSRMRDVMTLYAQGYSLANYLVQKGGRQKFLKLLAMAEEQGWGDSLEELYGIDDITSLESVWGAWVLAGSPELEPNLMLASNDSPERPASREGEIVRAQSPDASGRQQDETMVPEMTNEPAPAVVFGGFLPPNSTPDAEKPSRIADSETETSHREARPRPLGFGLTEPTDKTRSSAIETSHQQSDGLRDPLPRQTRIDQESQARNRNFFSSRNEQADRSHDSDWGGIGFPAPRTRSR